MRLSKKKLTTEKKKKNLGVLFSSCENWQKTMVIIKTLCNVHQRYTGEGIQRSQIAPMQRLPLKINLERKNIFETL